MRLKVRSIVYVVVLLLSFRLGTLWCNRNNNSAGDTAGNTAASKAASPAASQATANGRLTDSGRLQYTTKADNAPGSTAQKQDMVQTPTSAPTEVWETLAPTRSPRIQRVKASGPLPAPFNWKRSKDAIVVMSDARFFDCTLQLMATLTHPRKGNWAGDIIVLETPGPNRFMVNERTMFSKTYARTHCVKATYELPPTPNYGIGPTMQFAKVSLLTDPRFRVYRKLLYLDSDIVVKKPIHPLFDTDLPAKKSAAFRDNGVAFGKMNFYRNEIDTAAIEVTKAEVAEYKSRFPDRPLSGSTSLFVIEMSRLPKPAALLERVDELMDKFQPMFIYNDQSLMMTLLYHDFVTFMPCTGRYGRFYDNDLYKKTYVLNNDDAIQKLQVTCGISIFQQQQCMNDPKYGNILCHGSIISDKCVKKRLSLPESFKSERNKILTNRDDINRKMDKIKEMNKNRRDVELKMAKLVSSMALKKRTQAVQDALKASAKK